MRWCPDTTSSGGISASGAPVCRCHPSRKHTRHPAPTQSGTNARRHQRQTALTTFGDVTRHRRKTHPESGQARGISPAAQPCSNGSPAARHAAMPPQSIATLGAPSRKACSSHLCARQGQPCARSLPPSPALPRLGENPSLVRQPRPAEGHASAASLQKTSILPA